MDENVNVRQRQGGRLWQRHTYVLANLAGDIWLQPPGEDLVDDAVTVVWIVGLLPVVISCRHIKHTQMIPTTCLRLKDYGRLPRTSVPLQRSLVAGPTLNESKPQLQGFWVTALRAPGAYWHSLHRLFAVSLIRTIVSLLQRVSEVSHCFPEPQHGQQVKHSRPLRPYKRKPGLR